WSDLNDPKTEIVTYTDYIDNTDNTYNVKTRVVNVYDADNLNPVTVETETDYDYYGNPVKVVDAKQNPVIYQYDSMNREKSEKYVDGNSKSFEYFVKDNYIIIHDERDNLVKKQFDGLGREKASYVFNPQKALWLQVSAIEYDEWGRKKTETFFRNYDDSANVTEKFVFTYEYLTDGSLKHVYETDKNGSTQKDSNYKYEYGVTVSGLPGTFGKITETVKKKSTESYSPYIKYVNEYGQVRREETSHSQDGVNKIYSKTYGYDFVGNKLWEKNPRIDDEKLSNAYTTQYEYDYANHVTKETNAKLDFAVTKYDDLGRVKAKDDFNKYETTYTYDKLGRLVRTETPFVKDSNNNIITSLTKNYYDKNGNITTVLVQNNTPGDSTSTFNKTDYVYDSRNRLTEVIKYNTDNTKNITQYKYDAAGNKTYMYTGLSAEVETNTDTDFAVTSYLYNYLNQMVSMTDPQQRTITYKYDLAGNVIKANDRMGIETTYAYNSFGELIDKKATKDGTSKEVTFEYDLTGKRIIMVDESGTTNFEYDDIGRLITETAGSIVKSYGYDADGNRKTFTLIKSGSSVLSQSYDYDLTNRLWHVFENTNSIAEYKYDANGNRTTLKYPAIGVTANYNYNFANKLTNLDYGNGVSYTYTYYLDGNQKSKQGPEGSTIYTYDGVGRLAQVTSGTDSTLYQYDDYNNRSKMTVTGSANYTVGYNYDKNNCLLTEDKAQNGVEQITQYGYDDNGNQIYKGVETLQAGTGNQESVAGYTPGDSGSGSDVTIYDFDLFNQLLKVTQGATVVGYKYNGDGLRASKTIGTDTVSHVWDGDQIVVELKNGTVSGRFIRGINLIYSDMGGNVRYYFYNGHGDVTRLADGTGKIVKSYDYDEFGNEKGIEPGDVNPFRYCGEYFDKETGTIYLRARYYNPANGRFVSEDSVRGKDNDPLSLNLYTYCGNDPIDMFDPSGHQTVSSYAPEEYSDRVLYNERTAENPYIPSNVRDQITGGTQSNSGDGPNAIFNPKKDVYILGTENGDTAFAAKLGDDKASVYVGKVQGEVTKPCLNNDGFSVGIAGKAAGLQVNASNKYGDEKGNVNADIKVAATGGYGEVGLNFSANTKNPGFKAGGSVAAGRVDGETNMNIFFFHLKIAPHAAVLSAEANAKAGVDMEHMKVSGGFGLGLGLSAGVDFEVGPRENGK
ncbi:MAG TPA: RHS repeat-associated core domain-containing protein, partial [Clostridia bacterium]